MTKPVTFLGSSRDDLRNFPDGPRREAGHQLDRVQHGELPKDWKAMPTIGPGVREIRVRADSGSYRVIYVATFPEAVYVIHAFQKKTQQTRLADVVLARKRYSDLIRSRP